MATYEEIYGKRVEVLDADPTLTSANEGQVWYNSASGTLKSVVAVEAFVTQSNMPVKTAYNTSFGQAVPTTVSVGGMSSPGPAPASRTYEFNGSGWGTGGDLPAGRESGRAFGTLTAGTIAGGSDGSSPAGSTTTSEYDGTSWTAGNALPTAVLAAQTWGTQTAGFLTGGRGNPPSHSKLSASYTYDGTNWTGSTAMPSGRQFGGSSSSSPQTSALVFNGQNPSNTNDTIEWDGSSWTAAPNVTFTATQVASGGTATAALSAGGDTPPGGMGSASSKYDGSSWAAGASLGTARRATTGQGATGTSSMVMGGDTNAGSPPQYTTATEEYNFSVNTITTAAWSSTPAMSTGRYGGASGGTPTAAWYATGYKGGPGYTSDTEEYDGTSWTGGGAIQDGTTQSTGGCGTLTAGLKMGGSDGSPPYVETEEYNGSAWTAVPGNLNATEVGTSGCGTQTAGLYTRGRPSTVNEEYNGTSWTTANTISTTNRSGCNSGTQTAALYLGGEQPPGPYLKLTDEYDGTNWTAGGSLVIPQGISSNSGPSSDTMAASGYTTDSPWGPGNISQCQIYNGTSWATSANVSITRSSGGSSNRGCAPGASSDAAFVFGGSPVTPAKTGELFTAETSAVNAKTLTTS